MTSKQRSSAFILVPIDFSYMTSYRLSIGCSRTHRLTIILHVTDDDDGRNTVPIARPLVRSAKNGSNVHRLRLYLITLHQIREL